MSPTITADPALVVDAGPGPASFQMAADAAGWRAAEAGAAGLHWRFYSVVPAAVTAGWGERTVATDGVRVVRRPTGGRRLYQHRDVCVAVAGPLSHPLFSGGVRAAYARVGQLWQRVLAALGVGTELVGAGAGYRRARLCCETLTAGDLVVGGRKLVAGAQRRGARGALHHASMMLVPDAAAAALWLGIPVAEVRARALSLAEAAGREICYDAVVTGWRRTIDEEGW